MANAVRRVVIGKVSLNLLKANQIILSNRAMLSSAVDGYKFETLLVTSPRENVLNVRFNRPEKRNAMNRLYYKEFIECFTKIKTDSDVRAVILSGNGPMFTSGLDFMDFASTFMSGEDPSRKGIEIRRMVEPMQESVTILEKIPQPVIAAVHSACIGAGVDVITACDIRLCSSDAWFQVKEVEVGLAADLGTLQRLQKVIGNNSFAREICYTARKVSSDEARREGLVSNVYESREAMEEAAADLAEKIADQSPVAVAGVKANMVYSRDHTVEDGLDKVLTWNMGMLQSADTVKAFQAAMSKEKPKYSKL